MFNFQIDIGKIFYFRIAIAYPVYESNCYIYYGIAIRIGNWLIYKKKTGEIK